MKNTLIWLLLSGMALGGCTSLQNSSKYDLADGAYKVRGTGTKFNGYLLNFEDSIAVQNIQTNSVLGLPERADENPISRFRVIKSSLDLDILTAIFKYRPPAAMVPRQLNAEFNGNFYLGRRTDIYHLHYRKNPINFYERQINHFGFSGGAFVGFGSSAITPTTTSDAIVQEYDGLVLQKGVAGSIAINKLTIGLSLGFDNLLDRNQKFWVYQNKPWLGFMLGLNIN